MKNIIATFGLLLMAGSTLAQQAGDISLSLTGGRAGFSFTQMKEEAVAIKTQIPVQSKLLDHYPAYYYVGALASYWLSDQGSLGIALQSTATGSRISYGDYSGKLLFDQEVKGTQLGIRGGYKFWESKKGFTLEGALQASVMFTKLNMNSLMLVGDQEERFDAQFHSTGFAADPSLEFGYNFGMFRLGLQAGYCINFNGPLKWSEDSRATYQNSSGKDVKANWSGYRLGILLGIRLPAGSR